MILTCYEGILESEGNITQMFLPHLVHKLSQKDSFVDDLIEYGDGIDREHNCPQKLIAGDDFF